MKIIKVEIHNYRNLDGVIISFDENCNFIVGENNLGKSNLLSLFNILFSSRAFHLEDFKDPAIAIEINLQFKLADIEIGHFQDLFDADDYSVINIIAKQENTDDNIEFYHKETNTFISSSIVKCINYIHYDSLRSPIAEINFDKGKGVGRFLKNIVSQYVEDNKISDKDFLKKLKIKTLLKAINNKITKIKSFKDFNISAMPDDNIESLLFKMIMLKDGKGESLTKSGYGLQFLIMVILYILEKIQIIKQQRKDRGVFEDEAGGKFISLVLGLDEPEIHLHPYMQRSLIKYLNAVISNQNRDFQQLIKDLFEIDGFVGQIIVATHSPNIILNDYTQIVRFYLEKNLTKVISAKHLKIEEKLHRHLYIHFPFIKEAFFSRCAIFVEGDSEYASFLHFAQKLSIDFDDMGICIIKANGDAIPQLIELATNFGIPSVGIIDKDNGNRKITSPNLYQTRFRDFEEELIQILNSGNEAIIRDIFITYEYSGENKIIKVESLNKYAFHKYKVVTSDFTSNLKLCDIDKTDNVKLKSYYLTWLSKEKSYPLGKLIGEKLPVSCIPAIYKTVIKQAYKLVRSI